MNRLTNVGSNGEIWITDNDETRRYGRKESAYKKLAEYEDLEDRLNGISIQQVVDGFVKTIENQTHEGYEHGRILTNEEANQWNEYRQLDEQGLLLRLPTEAYFIKNNNVCKGWVQELVYAPCRKLLLDIRYDDNTLDSYRGYVGNTVFLTKAEAVQKLKEKEETEEENYPER